MHERHLRPDEIELLLDGEEGFGVSPLRAHVRACDACASELSNARRLMVALDALPDFAPSFNFADRVMSQVQVFEPLARRGRGSGPRVGAGVASGPRIRGSRRRLSAGLVTAAGTWAIARADIAMLLTQIGLENVRAQAGAALSDLTSTVLGQAGLDALRSGGPETLALATGGFVAVVGVGVVGLRALASATRPSR